MIYIFSDVEAREKLQFMPMLRGISLILVKI